MSVTRIRGLGAYPDRIMAKFKYMEFFYIGPSVTTQPITYQFRGNNAYDPYVTLGGGTPLNYLRYAQ